MATVYVPDAAHGKQIYDEIDKDNRLVNFMEDIIVPYTWHDFTDLVQYERNAGYQPYYSSMIAVNLMKSKFRQKFSNFKDLSYYTKEEAQMTFWEDNWIKIMDKIPTWDISTGVYFDKYYELNINDVARSTSKEINCITNAPVTNVITDGNKKKTVTKITASISLDLQDSSKDEEYSAQDKLVYSALNSSCAGESLNLDSYMSPELIYEQKEEISSKIDNGFYNALAIMNEKLKSKDNKLVINKKLASMFTFMEKFLDGDIKKNKYINEQLESVLTKTFLSAIVPKLQIKTVKKKEIEMNDEFDIEIEDEIESDKSLNLESFEYEYDTDTYKSELDDTDYEIDY